MTERRGDGQGAAEERARVPLHGVDRLRVRVVELLLGQLERAVGEEAAEVGVARERLRA